MKMKTYGLYLKSLSEAPDFEVSVKANSLYDALIKIKEEYGNQLVDFDDDTLLENIGVILDNKV